MHFDLIVNKAKEKFPDIKVIYKDQSSLMKLLGYLMFFNKSFMTHYFTTLGSTIYAPSRQYVESKEVSAQVTLLHELTHVYDSKKYSKILFGFLNGFPQILALLCLPLFFISWKLALPLVILFLLPLPAYFRMYFEKRGYIISLYALYQLSFKYKYKPLLKTQADFFSKQFTGPYYYFMYPFSTVQKDLQIAVAKIEANEKPLDDKVMVFIDELLDVTKNAD